MCVLLYLPTQVKQRPSEDFMSVGCSDGNVYVWQVPVLKILLLNCGFPSRCVGKMVGQRYWRLVTPPFRVAKYLWSHDNTWSLLICSSSSCRRLLEAFWLNWSLAPIWGSFFLYNGLNYPMILHLDSGDQVHVSWANFLALFRSCYSWHIDSHGSYRRVFVCLDSVAWDTLAFLPFPSNTFFCHKMPF